MNLKQCEVRLSELDERIGVLLKEREQVLKEWNVAFDSESPENVRCEVEKGIDKYLLYLVSGESKLLVCDLYNFEFQENINQYYKWVYHSIQMHNITNRRVIELKEWQKNLVVAKAVELRQEKMGERQNSIS